MTIKGSLYWSISMLKRFSAAKNCPVKIGPKNGGFGNLRVYILIVDVIGTPKRHILCRNDVFWRTFR